SPAPLDLLPHGVVEAVEDLSGALGILLARHGGRAHKIGEEDGRELALLAFRRRLKGSRAVQTEPGPLGILLTAGPACDGHGGILALDLALATFEPAYGGQLERGESRWWATLDSNQ